MATFTSVLCALDSSALASRVLRHAVGVAGAFGARLTVLTVTDGDPKPAEARLTTLLHTVIPPGATYAGEPTVQAARRILGSAADAILTEARGGFDLIVIGTHSQGGLRRWLLGSTSRMLLEEARCPVLLVPPGELDIVTLGPDAVSLHPGVVMAAVDPGEHNRRQLSFAGRFASGRDGPAGARPRRARRDCDGPARGQRRGGAGGARHLVGRPRSPGAHRPVATGSTRREPRAPP